MDVGGSELDLLEAVELAAGDVDEGAAECWEGALASECDDGGCIVGRGGGGDRRACSTAGAGISIGFAIALSDGLGTRGMRYSGHVKPC